MQNTTAHYQQPFEIFSFAENPIGIGRLCALGTREQILHVRQIIEKAYEFNVTVYLKILEKMSIPQHLMNLVRGLPENSKGKVKLTKIKFQTNFTWKQEYDRVVLFPLCFTVYVMTI